MRTSILFSLLLLLCLQTGAAASGPVAEPYASTYSNVTVPTTATVADSLSVPVTVTNTGSADWSSSGTTPVNLAYHWYTGSGQVLIWDGVRTALPSTVAAGASLQTNATVKAPGPGDYLLKIALVKEGVAWMAPETTAHAVHVTSGYAGSFTATPGAPLVAKNTVAFSVTATNIGSATWNSPGSVPVSLAYHIVSGSGEMLLWDSPRTSLPAAVVPGSSLQLMLPVLLPATGNYTLVVDGVRDGVGWLNTPARVPLAVQGATYALTYQNGSSVTALAGDSITVPLRVTNNSNQEWRNAGAGPTDFSYHLYTASGTLLTWDGLRTPLATPVAPGGSADLLLYVQTPAQAGSYIVKIDGVQEGVSWFSSAGASTSSIALAATPAYSAGYLESTLPGSALAGTQLSITVNIANYSGKTWLASGSTPVHLSYHIYDGSGRLITWDGNRGTLAHDLNAGNSLPTSVTIQLPTTPGNYTIVWDMVQEGVTWFSSQGVTSKRENITLLPSVSFYGKGFGHGVGMSQYGALGWATGIAGTSLSGAQIVAKYYPGANLTSVDPARGPIRVLITGNTSSSCGAGRVLNSWIADINSTGGFIVLNESAGGNEVGRAGTGTWQIAARAGVVELWDNSGTTPTRVYQGSGPLMVMPLDGSRPLTVVQKGLSYHGNLRFVNNGADQLRIVNFVNYDDYTKGVVPLEMPSGWHQEALRAQAYAARSYAYSSSVPGRSYDVVDSTYDQCYGGATAEKSSSNAAVDSTSNQIISYNGAPVKAYFASSNGGYTEGNGCVWGVSRTSSGYVCGTSLPYLQAGSDPADAAETSPWTKVVDGPTISNAVRDLGGDIGTFSALDMSNRSGSGRVISVKVYGSLGMVEYTAETFLRGALGLRSTLVRTTSW